MRSSSSQIICVGSIEHIADAKFSEHLEGDSGFGTQDQRLRLLASNVDVRSVTTLRDLISAKVAEVILDLGIKSDINLVVATTEAITRIIQSKISTTSQAKAVFDGFDANNGSVVRGIDPRMKMMQGLKVGDLAVQLGSSLNTEKLAKHQKDDPGKKIAFSMAEKGYGVAIKTADLWGDDDYLTQLIKKTLPVIMERFRDVIIIAKRIFSNKDNTPSILPPVTTKKIEVFS